MARRTRELVRISPAAIKLVMIGVVPTQCYGHQAMGASMAQIKKMRTHLKDATAFAGTWACTAFFIAWLFGPTADPMIRCPTEQLETWLATWKSISSQDRHDTRFTWHQHLVTLLSNQKTLNAKGPTAATINAIILTG